MPTGNTPGANTFLSRHMVPCSFTVARMLSQVAGYVGGVVPLA
jgi:hypothetical protein